MIADDSLLRDTPDASPDIMKRDPLKGRGIRRLNRVPLMIVIGLISSVAILIAYTAADRSKVKIASKKDDSDKKPISANTPPQFANQETINPTIPNNELPTNEVTNTVTDPTQNVPPIQDSTPSQPQVINVPRKYNPYEQDWANYKEQKTQMERAYQSNFTSALGSNSQISQGATPTKATQITNLGQLDTNQSSPQIQTQTDPIDFNGQVAKRNFFGIKPASDNYSGTYRTPAISRYEIKAGTIIPAIMISGINSDLPGQIIGQVSENVFDTKTGDYLLIPKGARLIGTYDNAITMGQSRVLVAWNRIIFPDASSINLNLMPGSDQSGYAGFNDKTNSHLSKTFANAMLLSAFSAGVQLSQPQSSQGTNISSGQTIAGAIGQQMGTLGEHVITNNMKIQPTLEIRPGFQFNVSVTKDLILNPLS